ncbi:hypothetical protein CDL15_Pgr010667 [Punica granatum]|uniref:Uncharacterized protein n=1 Tax=Punica granatum TaxID=22663 RepID=A0A218Y1U8_PUNGR|nr:hypothetical protein CDL15_Pgr010667 [Punica granatum]
MTAYMAGKAKNASTASEEKSSDSQVGEDAFHDEPARSHDKRCESRVPSYCGCQHPILVHRLQQRTSDQSSGHYSPSGNRRQVGGHRVMDCGRKAWSTEKGGEEPSEEQINKESRKQRSWHCGTIHHRVTEESEGAQYGILKIPLSAKVTNDTSERTPETSCLSRDTLIPHRRLF